MTKDDVRNIAQCLHGLVGCIENDDGSNLPFNQDEFDRTVDRFLWAIHQGKPPKFYEEKFRRACLEGTGTGNMFRKRGT